MNPIVLLRRQSPDWTALSSDFRRGLPIDPRRFVPDHTVPGFPHDVAALIGAWNERFDTDFFTFRALLVRLSAANLAAVGEASRYAYDQLSEIAALAHSGSFYLYPHDDDDFFAPYAAQVVRAAAHECDALVTPLFRIGKHSCTFVPAGGTAEHVLGEVRAQDFCFQTNNYAVHSRRLTDAEEIRAVKDHIEASAYADAHAFTLATAPQVLSATVKTPASASILAQAFKGRLALRRAFHRSIDALYALELPERYAWLDGPCRRIAVWLEAIYRGAVLDPAEDMT